MMNVLKKLFNLTKGKWFLVIVFSVVYSAVSVIGPLIDQQIMEINLSAGLKFMVYFVLCILVNLAVFSIGSMLPSFAKNSRFFVRFDKLSHSKLLFFGWIFIFVLWLPAYLILYPGVIAYDMMSQVYSALNTIANNHHPILHTWLIRVFLELGSNLDFGYEFGIGLLSLLQMVVLSYSLARMVCLLKKKNVPGYMVMIVLLLSGIWGMNACLSVTMIKDCLHAAFLVLFVCHFTEIVTAPLEYVQKRRNLVVFPIVSFLMCAFRNNGIYIFVFCLIILMILRIRHIKKIKMFIPLIAVICLTILMYEVYTGPVFKAFHIEQGQVREALSVPIQQLQRTAITQKDNLTQEQAETIAYYIDQLEWMEYPVCSYDPFIADYAKSCFYSERYTEDPIAFWKFYLQLGIEYPEEYAKAFMTNTLGFWYPGSNRWATIEYDNYPPESFVVPLERRSILNWQPLKDYYESVCTADFWRTTPILRLFFAPGFTLWFLLYSIALTWKKGEFLKKRLMLLLPLIGQYGIMILSPMTSFRYAWPFYLMLPVAFIAIFGKVENVQMITETQKK